MNGEQFFDMEQALKDPDLQKGFDICEAAIEEYLIGFELLARAKQDDRLNKPEQIFGKVIQEFSLMLSRKLMHNDTLVFTMVHPVKGDLSSVWYATNCVNTRGPEYMATTFYHVIEDIHSKIHPRKKHWWSRR